MLIIIPIIIANVHSAVWPFYFILYLPYIAEQLIYAIITVDYKYLYKRVHLFFRRKKLNNVIFMIKYGKWWCVLCNIT